MALPLDALWHHLLLVGAFAVTAAILIHVALHAFPKPLPGIPYNKNSSRRFFGDVGEIRQATYRRQWIWSQPSVHGSPISQAFLFPFRRPTVIVSDYRTAVDVCSRRVNEFDRGTRNRECVGLTAPNFHFTMQSSDPRLKQHRELLRDLMTPWFLSELGLSPQARLTCADGRIKVAAPRIYDRVSLLVELWALKRSKAGCRPFPAAKDLSMATLDMISSIAFGMEKSRAVLGQEILRTQAFQPEGAPDMSDPVEFLCATQKPEIEALLNMAEMMAIAQGSPFPTLAQWLALLKPRHARAHWHRRRLLRAQTAISLKRLARTGDNGVPESALEELLRREKRSAYKTGKTPEYWSPAIRDEVLGYLLGGHETSAIALAWWVKQMTRHQDVQRRLRHAIFKGHLEATAGGRCPTMTEIASVSIPYLDAVLEEALRCASVATLIVRQAKCDTQILGYPIPKGTDIIIPLTGPSLIEPALAIAEKLRSEACHKAKNRIPAWGNDVAEYKPERWLRRELGANGEAVDVFDALAGPNLAFSCGPRSCFGKKKAYLQLRTAVTLLLWRFAFEPIEGALDGWEIAESLVNLPKSCYVRLRDLHA